MTSTQFSRGMNEVADDEDQGDDIEDQKAVAEAMRLLGSALIKGLEA